MKTANDAPGPGQYNADVNKVRDAAPGYKLGTSKRGGNINSDAPGPGQYNYQEKNKHGAVFGKDERGSGKKGLDAPGPGQYTAPGMFDPNDKGKGVSFGVKTQNKP